MRLFYSLQAFVISSLGILLMSCANSELNTVSNKSAIIPAELYSTPLEKPALSNEISIENKTIDSSQDFFLYKKLEEIDKNINQGLYNQAQEQLNQFFSVLPEDPRLKADLIILKTKLYLLAGETKQALSWINQSNPLFNENEKQSHYWNQLKSETLYRNNHILLSSFADIENNSDYYLIWSKLLLVNPDLLNRSSHQNTIQAWIDLAAIAQKNPNQLIVLKNHLKEWQQTYPDHAANALLNSINAEKSIRPHSIAVILPLTGEFSNSGQAVQQGILSQYYHSPHQSEENIEFYDSESNDIKSIYKTIQERKTDLIIGPLTKEETKKLFNIAQSSTPIISLNYTQTPLLASQFQFGLSSEDEAKQVARLAWRHGKHSALIIVAKNEKRSQTAQAFSKEWLKLGGKIVDHYDYLNTDDFSKSISSLLKVSDSLWRQENLHKTIQTRLNSNAYFRKDADMVFLVAEPRIARQMRPFISFYTGNAIEIFSTSSLYEGEVNKEEDKDLNDVYFCDMPAILNPNHKKSENRLYFLGKDAYLLASQLDHLNSLPYFPLRGNSGYLTLSPLTHSIERRLSCAQIKNGKAETLS